MGIVCGKAPRLKEDSNLNQYPPPDKVETNNWRGKYSIDIACYMISANKMLVNRKDLPDFPNGTCELAVVDIDLGILNEATTRITRFNSAFQSPSIKWRGVSIKKQVPKYLPMNLWPGNIIVFGCLEAQSQVPHFSVTLAGKIGLEEVKLTATCNLSHRISATKFSGLEACFVKHLKAEQRKERTKHKNNYSNRLPVAEDGNRENSQRNITENGDYQGVQTQSPENFMDNCFLTRRSRLRESQDTGYISRKQSMDTQDGRDTALDLVDDTDATHAHGKCGSAMASIAEYRPLRFSQSSLAGLDENFFTRPLVDKSNIRRKDTPSHHGKSPFKLRLVGGTQEQFIELNEEEDDEHENVSEDDDANLSQDSASQTYRTEKVMKSKKRGLAYKISTILGKDNKCPVYQSQPVYTVERTEDTITENAEMINDVTEANETKCETEDFESNGVEKNSFHPYTVHNAEMIHGFNVENNRSSERRIVNDDIYTQFGPEQLFVVELPDNSDQVCLNKDLNFISTNETLIHIEAHDNNTISDEAIEHLKSIDSTNVHKPITTSDTATDFINNGKKAGNEEAVNDALVAKINTFQINFSANERDDTNIVRSYTGESANYTCYHNMDMKSVVVIENKESLEQRSVESEEVFNLELSDNSYQNSLTKDSQDFSRNDSSINGNTLEEDMPPSDSKELLSKQSKRYNDETLIHATFYDNQIISDEAIEHSKSIDYKNVQETLTACGTNSDCAIHDNNISQRKCPTANKKISVSEFTEKQRYYTSSRQKSPVLTNSGKVDYTKKNND